MHRYLHQQYQKVAIGLVASAALCAFICGVTEPFEFGFFRHSLQELSLQLLYNRHLQVQLSFLLLYHHLLWLK